MTSYGTQIQAVACPLLCELGLEQPAVCGGQWGLPLLFCVVWRGWLEHPLCVGPLCVQASVSGRGRKLLIP